MRLRILYLVLGMVGMISLPVTVVNAGDHGTSCGCEAACDDGCCDSGGDSCCSGSSCGKLKGKALGAYHIHLHRLYDGADLHFNCGCNGSYKFPVPPLYTYHWPGMYSQDLMTDYHSPWRFPPLRPYQDEADPVDPATASLPGLRPVSAVTPITASKTTRFVPMSERMQKYYR